MNKAVIFGLLAIASPALAGGKEGSIGVGAEYGLDQGLSSGSVGGISLNYDAGIFHAGGMLGFDRTGSGDAARTTFSVGARFFYHVHSTGMADFGVGGEIGLLEQPRMGVDGHDSILFINPGFQIRAFITPNVALSFTAGLVVATADGNEIALTGKFNALGGVHYYF